MGLFLFRSKNEMVYQKFVEVGRVAVLADTGKIAAVVDVINQNRALVEGPGIPRQSMNIKNLHLTKKFEASGWGQRIKKASLRANLSDFEKFKVKKLKVQRRRLINQQVNKAAKKGKK